MAEDIVGQLDPIFRPRAIAVVGASNQPRKWGYWMVDRPLKAGFRGTIYPVNPKEKQVLGLPCYPSIRDVPDPVDMMVVAVPAPLVPQVMRDAIQRGIKGAVVVTAGFAETGEKGRALQDEVVRIARQGGIRFVGPNGNAIFSSAVNLCLSFDQAPRAGFIGFISQSGTFGSYLAQIAMSKGYGLSKFISIGNQAEIDAADYLAYLAEDPDTKAIVLYMEGFKQGHRFFKIAREVIKRKPILIYKAGRTAAAARAALSHTAALAGSDQVFEGMCRQLGMLRAEEALHTFDMAEALVGQPLPPGNRVAIIGSGGQSVVTSEACALLGMEIPRFDDEAVAMIRQYMAPHAPEPRNPVDFAGAPTSAVTRGKVLEIIAGLDCVDGIITNLPEFHLGWGPPVEEARTAIDGAELFSSIPRRYGKPIVTLNWHGAVGESRLMMNIMRSAGIPCYFTPEECARAMHALVSYGGLRRGFAGL
ncbi:MAG: CoA-binding protein [Chloroflexota bacterium]|nr:CoA-binding protein [Chloroflexota bacterium]